MYTDKKFIHLCEKMDYMQENLSSLTSSLDNVVRRLKNFTARMDFLDASLEVISARLEILDLKIDNHTLLSRKNNVVIKDFLCAICYEDIPCEAKIITSCDHLFHYTCLSRWLDIKNECPFCRNVLDL